MCANLPCRLGFGRIHIWPDTGYLAYCTVKAGYPSYYRISGWITEYSSSQKIVILILIGSVRMSACPSIYKLIALVQRISDINFDFCLFVERIFLLLNTKDCQISGQTLMSLPRYYFIIQHYCFHILSK